MEWRRGEFRICDDPRDLDFDAVHAYLTRSYWATGISRHLVERAARHSLNFGLFDATSQVGYARVVTDRATFANLCDVYVLESFRGRGLGCWLIEVVMGHPDVQGLRRWQLVTRDAHGLYAKFGWQSLDDPARFMQIVRPQIYLENE